MNAATLQALRSFLNDEIETAEAIQYDDADMDEDFREECIKEREIRILRLNQLMDLVHAAYQDAL